MKLFVIRHAIAEDRRKGRADEDRALTSKGERRFRRVVRGLDDLGVRVQVLVHSPWRRAAETAELAAKLVEGATVVSEHLTRSPSPALLDELKELAHHREKARLAVVGHEPWLTELIAWLTLGERAQAARFVLKKGGVAHLEGALKPGGMALRALLTPRALR